jgi:glycosyltransferase involved in cell wall biosynthesis
MSSTFSPETMHDRNDRVRVLYSFPLRLGADRICYTAWEQVNGLAAAGASITVMSGSVAREVPQGVVVKPTLSRGKIRIPYRLLGTMRAVALHDAIVASRLEQLADQIDIIHTWPLGALKTLKAAVRLGIPTVLERPNANTRFAMEVVQQECERLGVLLPAGHEHAYDGMKLRKEEEEYQLADRLLCPSDFVVKTFIDRGYPEIKLARHQYGFDEDRYFAGGECRQSGQGLTVLFAGVCAVRKGLHYALDAWLRSPASQCGRLLIAGEFLPDYQAKLARDLAHPSVRMLGHRTDVPELMRKSDILVLPSIEEGSALVTSEARASGCVLLVSEAAGANCRHMENALVHSAGDVATLAEHFTLLHNDRKLLQRLREVSLASVPEITCTAAGRILLDVYRETIATYNGNEIRESRQPSQSVAVEA